MLSDAITLAATASDAIHFERFRPQPWTLRNRRESHLSIRAFKDRQKRQADEKQSGICPVCGKHFQINEMEADHTTPWHAGGKTTAENCKMLCKEDNRRKSGI